MNTLFYSCSETIWSLFEFFSNFDSNFEYHGHNIYSMTETNLVLSSENLKNAFGLEEENSFIFRVGMDKYHTSKTLAAYLSPKIAMILHENPSNFYYQIQTPDPNHYFSDLIQLAHGISIHINDKNEKFFLDISKELENSELSSQIYKTFSDKPITMDNIFDQLHKKLNFSIDPSPEFDFLATNFSEFCNEELNQLSDEELRMLFTNPKLQVSNENELLELILSRSSYSSNLTSLLSFILVENLDDIHISQFMDNVPHNEVTPEIWNSLKRCIKSFDSKVLLKEEPLIPPQNDSILIPFLQQDPLNGVFSFLRKESIHYTTSASANSGDKHASVTDPLFKSYWYSGNIPDSWWGVDFGSHAIKLSHYSIKTDSSEPPYPAHIKSWAIEGSCDGIEWKTLDEHRDSSELNCKSFVKSFEISDNQTYYRYLRLKNLGQNYANDFVLRFSRIEFFGALLKNEI